MRGDGFGADAVYCGRPIMGFSGCRPMGGRSTTAVNTAADGPLARNALLDDALCAYVHDRSRPTARCWCRREAAMPLAEAIAGDGTPATWTRESGRVGEVALP